MPKITFDSSDAIPDGLKEFMKEEAGKYVVDVVASTKLAEFRDNNIRLAQERDAMKGIVDRVKPIIGDDVDAFLTSYQEMNGVITQVRDGKLKGTDAIENEVTARVAQMKTGYESQLQSLGQKMAASEQRATQADQRYRRSIVDQAVTAAAINETTGALPTALPDILRRAYNVFQVSEDGKLVAKDGDAVIYGADGASPMTPLEWVTSSLREQAPHFFRNSNGGGAAGGGTAGDAKFGGLSSTEFNKLSPMQKLNLANKTPAKR